MDRKLGVLAMGKFLSLVATAVIAIPLTGMLGAGPASATGSAVGLSVEPLAWVRSLDELSHGSAAAVNASGQIVGTSSDNDRVGPHGFLTDPTNTAVTRLDSIGPFPAAQGTDVSSAHALNDAGVAVGTASLPLGDDAPSVAVVWDAAGTATSLGTIGNRPCTLEDAGNFRCHNSAATGINNTGTAVGSSQLDDGSGGKIQHAFADALVTNTMTDLGTLAGGTNSGASGVNDAGIVVGASETTNGGSPLTSHAFTYDPATTTMTDLGALAGGTSSTASAINAIGLVAGTSAVTGGATHPFTYDIDTHTMTDLGLPPGATNAGATALNDDGLVVGNSDAGAWVYDPLSKTFTIIAGADDATGVSDSGEIVGHGLVPDGAFGLPDLIPGPYRTFIWPPTVLPGVGTVVESNSGSTSIDVPVTLSNPSTKTITVAWTTEQVSGAPAGQADPATDYTPASGTVTFNSGETAKTVTIAVRGDLVVEPDEYIVVSFHDPTNAVMGGFWGLGIGAIVNDDHATVLPGSGVVAAPASGSADLAVGVSLSNPSTLPVTVHWTTLYVPGAPDSIFGPEAPVSDYTPASGTVTFAPGDTSATVHIPVTGGTSTPAEYVVVSFTDPTNAHVGGYWGLGFGFILPAP